MRIVVWAVVVAVAAGGIVCGMHVLRARIVEDQYRGPQGRATVRLVRVPHWMPESLARLIASDVTPPGASLADRHLARKVHDIAQANPWVRRIGRVHVHPPTGAAAGVVEADLEFRRPFARVRCGSRFLCVDAEGCRLPVNQVPMWVVTVRDSSSGRTRQVCFLSRGEAPASWRPALQRIHYVVIDGVRATPPPPGWLWKSEDLQAGLCLVDLVSRRPYYAQITVVDVRNYQRRISRNEPALRMFAQIGRGPATDIRFGRFPAPGGGDYVVSPQRKISYLDEYAGDHGGRLAGINSYLDLRFDELHVSIH